LLKDLTLPKDRLAPMSSTTSAFFMMVLPLKSIKSGGYDRIELPRRICYAQEPG
jgi:hypothetical protein